MSSAVEETAGAVPVIDGSTVVSQSVVPTAINHTIASPSDALVFGYNIAITIGIIASLLASLIVLQRTWRQYRSALRKRSHSLQKPTDTCPMLSIRLVSEMMF